MNQCTYLLLACYLWAAPCWSETEKKLSDIEQLVDNTRTMWEMMQSDPHRPIYHFIAPEGYAHKVAIFSPFSNRATKRIRSSILQHSRHGICVSPAKA